MSEPRTRTEKDSMGAIQVPAEALYGAQTARAVNNFPISGRRMPARFLHAVGLVKWAAVRANASLGLVDARIADAVERAADEVARGQHDAHFPVDVFQTGSGTSTNMNANEVIANRANQILGEPLGTRSPVHPNDHVNFGQSSNDVIPTALHVAAAVAVSETLLPALDALIHAVQARAEAFDDILKIGRTHLQDATPIRLGQEFRGFAGALLGARGRLAQAAAGLEPLALGGTAVGTGLNTHPEFGARAAAQLAERTGIGFFETDRHFTAQSTIEGPLALSASLRGLASAATKIANDIRWLGSGPRLGLGELAVPALQPGSSIMPGKVNPVVCEALIMVGAQVHGLDATIALCAGSGNFQLNTMLPLVAFDLLEQIALLGAGLDAFRSKVIDDLGANADRIAEKNEQSLALATALVPHIGYDKAAKIAKKAHETGRTVRDVARQEAGLDEAALDEALDLRRQTAPGLG